MRRLTEKTKNALRQIRHRRVRTRVRGTAEAPRLSVFRGLRSLIVQLVDDEAGKTLCAVHSREIKNVEAGDRKGKVAVAYSVGKVLAEKAKAKGVSRIVFDRGGYKYHGRVQAAAAGARDGGLQF